MKMNKFFAAIAATAVSVSAFAAMSMTSASAADQIGQAALQGSFGTESSWDFSGTKASVATIDGDAQYEVKWTVSEATTPGDSCFLTVVIDPVGIDNFTTATLTNLTASLDKVYVDGTEITGFDASAAVDTNYYEGSNPGRTRIYLRGDWAGNATRVLANDQAIESEIKVLFTVSGTGQEGTSNVTPTETETSAAETTTTTAGNKESSSTTTTTKAADNKSTTTAAAVTSANTGDAGVGVAVAVMALAGTAAFVARKKD